MIPIYRDRLRLDVMVTNTFAAILSLRPDHPEALKALAERHEAHGRWADLIDVLQPPGRRSAPTRPRRCRLYHRDRRAVVREAGQAAERGRARWRRSWRSTRPRRPPGAACKEIYTRGRSWRPLLDLMRRELQLLPQAPARAPTWRRWRRSPPTGWQPRARPSACGTRCSSCRPREPIALAALAKLYEKEGRWAAAGRDPGPPGDGRSARTPRRAASCSSGAA